MRRSGGAISSLDHLRQSSSRIVGGYRAQQNLLSSRPAWQELGNISGGDSDAYKFDFDAAATILSSLPSSIRLWWASNLTHSTSAPTATSTSTPQRPFSFLMLSRLRRHGDHSLPRFCKWAFIRSLRGGDERSRLSTANERRWFHLLNADIRRRCHDDHSHLITRRRVSMNCFRSCVIFNFHFCFRF